MGESSLLLRQLIRQVLQRITVKGGSVIRTSQESQCFRLLLREQSGTSSAFRATAERKIQHFIAELAGFIWKLKIICRVASHEE